MVYKITIKTGDDTFKFVTTKKPITKTEIDLEGNEVQIPTGYFQTVVFETSDISELKAKYVELLNTYRIDQLNAIADVDDFVNLSVDIEEVETKEADGE